MPIGNLLKSFTVPLSQPITQTSQKEGTSFLAATDNNETESSSTSSIQTTGNTTESTLEGSQLRRLEQVGGTNQQQGEVNAPLPLPENTITKEDTFSSLPENIAAKVDVPELVPETMATKVDVPVSVPENIATKVDIPVSVPEKPTPKVDIPVSVPENIAAKVDVAVSVPEKIAVKVEVPVSIPEKITSKGDITSQTDSLPAVPHRPIYIPIGPSSGALEWDTHPEIHIIQALSVLLTVLLMLIGIAWYTFRARISILYTTNAKPFRLDESRDGLLMTPQHLLRKKKLP